MIVTRAVTPDGMNPRHAAALSAALDRAAANSAKVRGWAETLLAEGHPGRAARMHAAADDLAAGSMKWDRDE